MSRLGMEWKILRLYHSRTRSLGLKVSQAWVLVWEWKVTEHREFPEAFIGLRQGKLQVWLDQRSGSNSLRFSQLLSPLGFGFVPSPSTIVPRWPSAATWGCSFLSQQWREGVVGLHFSVTQIELSLLLSLSWDHPSQSVHLPKLSLSSEVITHASVFP